MSFILDSWLKVYSSGASVTLPPWEDGHLITEDDHLHIWFQRWSDGRTSKDSPLARTAIRIIDPNLNMSNVVDNWTGHVVAWISSWLMLWTAGPDMWWTDIWVKRVDLTWSSFYFQKLFPEWNIEYHWIYQWYSKSECSMDMWWSDMWAGRTGKWTCQITLDMWARPNR